MSKKLHFSANYQSDRGEIELAVDVVNFIEDGVHFIFAPALDLTGYGNTLSEAKNSFEIIIGEFFTYTMSKGTIEKELRDLGWQITKSKKGLVCIMPDFAKLVDTNEQLGELVNSHAFEKTSYHTRVPAFAF